MTHDEAGLGICPACGKGFAKIIPDARQSLSLGDASRPARPDQPRSRAKQLAIYLCVGVLVIIRCLVVISLVGKSSSGTFAPVGCHPGCFPAGSAVLTPDGCAPIESLREGDSVLSIKQDGRITSNTIDKVFTTRTPLVRIETDVGTFCTTRLQPLLCEGWQSQAAGDLRGGERLLFWREGKIVQARVVVVTSTGERRAVFNLILHDEPQTLVIDSVIAQSKPPVGEPYQNDIAATKAEPR